MLLKITSKRKSIFGYRIIKNIAFYIIINRSKSAIEMLPKERKHKGCVTQARLVTEGKKSFLLV